MQRSPRELSSEEGAGVGAGGRKGRRQFAWRLRVLLGLEAGTGNWAEKATGRQATSIERDREGEAGRAREREGRYQGKEVRDDA